MMGQLIWPICWPISPDPEQAQARIERSETRDRRCHTSSSVPDFTSFNPATLAGLVPATPIILVLCSKVRGRRDKPGDDAGM